VELYQLESGDSPDASDEWSEVGDDTEDDLNVYEYDWHEDDNAVPRKVRKRRQDKTAKADNNIMNAREPFYYHERVEYFTEGSFYVKLSAQDIEEDILADMQDVYPLGYPAEQYLVKLKNDLQEAFIQLREEKRRALEEMKRQLFEGNATSL
jgi:hypothetical protein